MPATNLKIKPGFPSLEAARAVSEYFWTAKDTPTTALDAVSVVIPNDDNFAGGAGGVGRFSLNGSTHRPYRPL
jgi:hypothetical protein